ncbi:ell-associated factor Eaf [Coccinella septempunctata]|uniref:ell-associated factor Eaf n=1 Tax=Coccinella septempunctata TaxID=41139 RepID=UPI001D086724|nr:ell-associated factor Eaf [Coccinella septempunctata]
MAEKLGIKFGNEVRELKIGQSFTNPKSTAFHTIKYDFKPASVDKNKIATVDVGNNHQVAVTVPHLDGSGVPQTVFKGSQRPYTKECVLVIDKRTGEITLERLSCNIQVKKTRNESSKIPHPTDRLGQGSNERSSSSSLASRSSTPPVGQRVSSKTKVTSGSRRPDRPITNLIPKHSPLQSSPRYPSPNQQNKSPKDELRNFNNDNHTSASASLPMIGMDDFTEPRLPVSNPHHLNSSSSQHHNASVPLEKPSSFQITSDEIGEISDSSSSSSDAESDSEDEANSTVLERNLTSNDRNNGHCNGIQNSAPPKFNSVPTSHLLKEDLCLSESGSDSDSD